MTVGTDLLETRLTERFCRDRQDCIEAFNGAEIDGHETDIDDQDQQNGICRHVQRWVDFADEPREWQTVVSGE